MQARPEALIAHHPGGVDRVRREQYPFEPTTTFRGVAETQETLAHLVHGSAHKPAVARVAILGSNHGSFKP